MNPASFNGAGFFIQTKESKMKCSKLTVVNVSNGSTWTIMEMGGVNVSNGDAIICESNIAKRMLTQYRGMLLESGEIEMTHLSGGHYHVQRNGNDEPKAIQTKPGPVIIEHETPADKADDKSMAGRGKRFKKK